MRFHQLTVLQKLVTLEGQTEKFTIILGDVNTLISAIVTQSRKVIIKEHT